MQIFLDCYGKFLTLVDGRTQPYGSQSNLLLALLKNSKKKDVKCYGKDYIMMLSNQKDKVHEKQKLQL